MFYKHHSSFQTDRCGWINSIDYRVCSSSCTFSGSLIGRVHNCMFSKGRDSVCHYCVQYIAWFMLMNIHHCNHTIP